MEKLNALAEEGKVLGNQRNEVEWAQFTTGLDFGVEEAQRKYHAFFKSKENYKIVCDQLQREMTAEDRRRTLNFYNRFKGYHLSDKATAIREKEQNLQNKVADVLNKHRAELNGRPVATTDLSKILQESPDRELRKQAWFARTQVNRPLLEAGFLDLLNLRKDLAAACDFRSYIEYRLDEDELDPALFAGWKDECRKRKGEYSRRQNEWAQKTIGAEVMEPWDGMYITAQVCPHNKAKVDIGGFFEPLADTFADFGFEIRNLNLTYDVFPRKNKSEWGYLFTLAPGRDSRILANVNDRFSSYNVLLHETAHGVHFLGLDADDSMMNMAVSGIVAEGFANFFGAQSYSKEFLRHVFKDGDVDAIYSEFEKLKSIQRLGRLESMFLALFDQELYLRDLRSIEDIHDLKWEMIEDLTGKKPFAPEPTWGYLIHHTIAPVYLHNYFLGDVINEEMMDVFQRRHGVPAASAPKEFGRFWYEQMLKPSGRYSFSELFERVCERPLTLDKFLQL